MSDVIVNIYAQGAFGFFHPDVKTKSSKYKTEDMMKDDCVKFANGEMSREDLVNSLVSFIEHGGN